MLEGNPCVLPGKAKDQVDAANQVAPDSPAELRFPLPHRRLHRPSTIVVIPASARAHTPIGLVAKGATSLGHNEGLKRAVQNARVAVCPLP